MRPIIVLEPNIANKIAAGEVVERPASIVKELLENSLDAGATSVTVEITNGGIDHIRITDNGCGIPESDVKLAFMRHATSKISSIEELDSLSSFGFRGEALASIAAVARVTLRTRTENAEYGTKLCVDGGRFSEPEICACPIGTTIEVDDLFYNVPARLKFIKNSRSEAAMITDYTSRIMLANPDISIKLLNGGRTVLHTFGYGSLSNAILCVYGSSVFASLYEVDYDDGYISIKGFAGGELTARANRIQQSIFVNKRYVKSAIIGNAVQRAYLTKLMTHRFPFFVLNVLISSREVDVNVHPNKLSVRFGDEERVARAVTAAVGEALKGQPVSMSIASFVSKPEEIQPEAPAASAFPHSEPRVSMSESASSGKNTPSKMQLEASIRDLFRSDADDSGRKKDAFDFYQSVIVGKSSARSDAQQTTFGFGDPGASNYPDFTPNMPVESSHVQPVDSCLGESCGKSEKTAFENAAEPKASENGIPVYTVHSAESEKPASNEKHEQLSLDADTCTVIGAAFDTYIIVQQGDALYYIDQHAAHERILYERLISGNLKFDSQFVAPPIELSFDPIAYECLITNKERFSEFGYSFGFLDDCTVQVLAVPGLDGVLPERFLRDAVDMMLSDPDTAEVDLMRARLIQMSCKRAVKAGNDLEVRQLKAIVDAYSTGEVPLTCPHGRPVIIRVTKTELQKMFKRIV